MFKPPTASTVFLHFWYLMTSLPSCQVFPGGLPALLRTLLIICIQRARIWDKVESSHHEGDSNIWADRCGGAMQGGMDREGPHPASHAEIQKTPGAGTVEKFAKHLSLQLRLIAVLAREVTLLFNTLNAAHLYTVTVAKIAAAEKYVFVSDTP